MGKDQSPERLLAEAEAIGWPVLIKAVAGGGGKGMRKVDAAADFAAALESCRREAAASFGNDEVLLEKWISSPRHIEVQVFGDTHGNVVHLFERDCSLQRRHQKVIEEAPAPGMDPATREALCAAAVHAAKAVDYVGAGTIEFIADASAKEGGGLSADRIFFMEMNTRLQVEHPVTEEITGVDLVEWQLRVASGEELPLRQEQLAINGHAIEARLYAEDPATGFLPSTGILEHFALNNRGRVETGVEQGGQITPFYDPMIAKLIAHDETRAGAIERLAEIISDVQVWPVKTNASFIARLLSMPEFQSAELDTGLIERSGEALTQFLPGDDVLLGAISWRLEEFMGAEARGDFSIAPQGLFGFRLNCDPAPARFDMTINGKTKEVSASPSASGDNWKWLITIDNRSDFESIASLPTAYGPNAEDDPEGTILLFKEGAAYSANFASNRISQASLTADGAVLAPMPGKVITVDVAEGDTVTRGQRLMVLEAMKMEHALTAPFDGTVAELKVAAGDQAQVEALLARVEKRAD
jgi:acetyl/propionyl-CoA carboxylase alpha subunit